MSTKPWGIYETAAPADMSVITALAAQMGSKPSYIQWYQKFLGSTQAYNATFFTNVLSYSAIPILTWMPLDGTGGIQISNADVIAGTYDTLIDSFATGIKALAPSVVYIRLAHEVNGNWYPWCVGQNGNTASSYINMWRHVHGRFDLQSVTNVRWVYCPNVHFGSPPGTGDTATYAATYPGDAYVDLLALDGYNYGDDSNGHTWNTFNTVFSTSVADICAVASKPFYISEMGCVEEAGKSKAAWIQDALTAQIANDSRISAFVWYDFVNGSADFHINTSTDSVIAFACSLSQQAGFSRFSMHS